MASVIVECFITDILDAAKVAILERIDSQEQRTGDNVALEHQHASMRRDSLDAWLGGVNPLGYTYDSIERLAKALHYHPSAGELELPQRRGHTITATSLAIAFTRVATKPSSYQSPFESGFKSLRLLPIAQRWYCAQPGGAEDIANGGARFHYAILVALVQLQVQRIPVGRDGNRKGNDYTKWFELPHLRPLNGLDNRLHTQPQCLFTPEQRRLIRDREPWDCRDVALKDLGNYINRVQPPTTFTIDNASLEDRSNDDMTRETYLWVLAKFDLADPICKYVMFVGIVVSKICDHIRHVKRLVRPPAAEGIFNFEGSPEMNGLTLQVRDAAWTTEGSGGGTSSKGNTEEKPFVVMFTVYVLAYMWDDSPLRLHIERTKGAGTKWTSKHGTLLHNSFSHNNTNSLH